MIGWLKNFSYDNSQEYISRLSPKKNNLQGMKPWLLIIINNSHSLNRKKIIIKIKKK